MHYTLCDYLADVIENSIQANSSIIEVIIEESEKEISCSIKDNGKGMDEETLKEAIDPFYTEEGKHPERRFGFGLPFLTQAVSATGGNFDLDSTPGKGTKLKFDINLNNVDAPPVGDITGTILAAVCYEGDYELTFKRGFNQESYIISRKELSEVLGDLTDASNLFLAKQYIQSQENDLKE